MSQTNSLLEHISLTRSFTAEELLATINSQGVAVVPKYLSREIVLALSREVNFALNDSPNGVYISVDNQQGRAARIDHDEIKQSSFSTMKSMLDDTRFESVVDQYFGLVNRFPMQFFVARSLPNSLFRDELPYVPHIDREQTLKFLYYLTDTCKGDGPFQAIVGEAKSQYRAVRHQWREKGVDEWDRPNLVDIDKNELLSVTGPSGTLVVFDTDVPHCHGDVDEGRERTVFRIDTCGPEMYFPNSKL